jgi:hypothetical protein
MRNEELNVKITSRSQPMSSSGSPFCDYCPQVRFTQATQIEFIIEAAAGLANCCSGTNPRMRASLFSVQILDIETGNQAGPCGSSHDGKVSWFASSIRCKIFHYHPERLTQ